jgi:HSP20 family protein
MMRELRRIWPVMLPDTPAPWRPLVDVYRTRNGWLLKFDLPGVHLEDVRVSASGRRVSISGVRHDAVVEEGSTYYSMEISYNRFERTVEIPANVERASVRVEARDGTVLVRVIAEGNENVR